MFDVTHRMLAPAAAVIALVSGLSGAVMADEGQDSAARGGSGIPQLASADFQGSGGRFSFVTEARETDTQALRASGAPGADEQARPRDDSFGGFLNALAGDAVWAIESVVEDWR